MIGRQAGKILELRLVDIHGAKFYDIAYALDSAPDKGFVSRVGAESVYNEPNVGDAVILHLVMGQITKVERRETP